MTDPIVDLHQMWCAQSVVAQALDEFIDAQRPALRWRIPHNDWAAVLRHAPLGAITHKANSADSDRLYGVPVDLVQPAPDRHPELVLICDRRVTT